MARKKVEEFTPRGVEEWIDGKRHYHFEHMLKVMAAVDLIYQPEDAGPSRPSPYADLYMRLKKSLDQYALTYEMRRTEQERPTLSAMAKEFRQIEAAAFRLLEALHITSKSQELPGEVERGLYDAARQELDVAAGFGPALGFPGYPVPGVSTHIKAKETIQSGLKGVMTLADLAGRAAAIREQLIAGAPEPRRGKDEAEDNFVAGLMHTWKRCFGRTDVTTQAFRRFAYAAITAVDPDVPEHSIRGRVVRLLQTDDFIDFQSPSTN